MRQHPRGAAEALAVLMIADLQRKDDVAHELRRVDRMRQKVGG